MHSREPNTPEWIISTSVLICTLPPTFLWCALPSSLELLIQCNKFSQMRDEFISLNISHKTSPSTIWSPILAGSTILWKLIWLNHGRKHKTNQKTNKQKTPWISKPNWTQMCQGTEQDVMSGVCFSTSWEVVGWQGELTAAASWRPLPFSTVSDFCWSGDTLSFIWHICTTPALWCFLMIAWSVFGFVMYFGWEI